MHFRSIFISLILSSTFITSANGQAEPLSLPGPLQTHVAAVFQSPDQVLRMLRPTLPPEVKLYSQEGATLLNYAGDTTPPELLTFLKNTVSDLDLRIVSPPEIVNLSIALTASPAGHGSEVRVMVSSSALKQDTLVHAALGASLPDGASVLMNEGNGRPCNGQIVLSQSGAPADVSDIYVARLETQGFDVFDASNETTSFFVGQQPDCSIFLYIQPDTTSPERSMVVLRYLEE